MTPLAWGALAAAALLAGATILWGARQARAHARARRQLDRRIQELFAVQELTYVLGDAADSGALASRVADYLQRFFQARGTLVALAPDQEGRGSLRIAAANGTLAPLAGRALDERAAGMLATAIGQERLELAEREDGPAPLLVAGCPVDRAAVVPLRAHGVPVGALALADWPRPFPAEDLRLLTTVATQVALVLANARLFELVRRARDEWEQTFDALTIGLAVLDGEDRVRRGNRALARLVGEPIERLFGQGVSAVLADADGGLALLCRQVRADGGTGRQVLRGRSGSRVLRVSAAPFHGAGEAAWIVLLVEDITDQERLEAQLIQHEKMAAVGQLVSGVAHELNNPLTSVAGLAEFLLEQTDAGAPSREHLRVIHEQAERAGRIVRNLLTFARRGPADLSAIDLNDIVQRTVSLVGYEIRLREVDLVTTLDPALPRLAGDRYQLQQVVVNLVTNALQAVRANPAGRARRIRVTTRHVGEDVVLSVADSGPGIPPETASQVFTPFFTTKAPGEGTGLGLAIAYRIVEGHGGRLLLSAAADGGAEFEVRLPVTGAPAPAAPAPPGGPATAADVLPRHDVLLLDGDVAVRTMIQVLLATEGRQIEATDDARTAVALLEARRFDLILADPRAAVSAGERFGDYLLQRWPGLKDRTIFLTADVRPETQEWLASLGCRWFVKPFRVAELKAAAAKLLAAAAAPSTD